MHFMEGIKGEWDLVEKYMKKDSIAIFDDLKLKGVKILVIGLLKNIKIIIFIKYKNTVMNKY